MLRQGAERPQARAQRHHHVGARDQLHRRLRALVAQRAAPQRVAGRERVVVQVAVDHRCTEALGQRLAFLDGIGHHHAAAGDDHRELGVGQQFGRFVQALLAAGAAVEVLRLRNLGGDLAVEMVARDVQLGRAHFGLGAVEAARGELSHARRVGDVPLVLGELLEHRQLVGFLEATQADAHGAGLGGDDHHRAVGPVGGGDRGHAVGDAGAVLADHHAVAARHAGVAVGHVAGALLVHHRDQADAGRREDVHRVHEGRAHDAEHVGHAVGGQRFDEGFGRGHGLRAGGNLAVLRGGRATGNGGIRGGFEVAHGVVS